MAKAVKSIQAANRWAVTGTPVQNRLKDLASLLQFLQIHPFSNLKAFDQHVLKPWKDGHPDAITKLTMIFQCVALRRSKDVIDLPERRDEIHYVAFNDDERDAYDTVKNSTLHQINELMDAPESTASKYLNVLQWINSLRLVCNLGRAYKKQDTSTLMSSNWTIATAQETYQSLHTSGAAICTQCSLDIGFDCLANSQLSVSEVDRPHLSKCLELLCGECYQCRLTSSDATCSKSCQFQQSCTSFEVTPSESTRSQVDVQTSAYVDVKVSSSKILFLIDALKNSRDGEKRYELLVA